MLSVEGNGSTEADLGTRRVLANVLLHTTLEVALQSVVSVVLDNQWCHSQYQWCHSGIRAQVVSLPGLAGPE